MISRHGLVKKSSRDDIEVRSSSTNGANRCAQM